MTTQTTQNGRSPDGKFAPGNEYGKQRRRRDVEAEYVRAVHQAVSPEDLGRVIKKMLQRAEGGSISAAKVLLSYAIGRPVTRLEFVDDEEELRVAGVPPAETVVRMQSRFDRGVAALRAAQAETNAPAPPGA